MLVQSGFYPCSLLGNTAQPRLPHDHVLKSILDSAVVDTILFLYIVDIHSALAVLMGRVATAGTDWPSPRSVTTQEVSNEYLEQAILEDSAQSSRT